LSCHIEYDFFESENFGSAERQARMFADNGYETIVVVGGDGVLQDALNGILSSERAGNVSLGIIPNGIANDFASYWGMTAGDYKTAIDCIIARRVRKVDVGCCSYDTDVFEIKQPQIVKWDAIGKSVKRMGIDEFIRVGVKSSIEDWILDDMHGICNFLRLKQVPSSLKGINGYQKLLDLYNKARKTYKKGYETKELINTLDMSVIRNKRQDVLAPLEEALGVVMA
jgi:predicted polyphosphate/ATP-dependent NAD kinase